MKQLHDRADELRTLDDLWPEIEKHIENAAKDAIYNVRRFELDLDEYLRPNTRALLEEKFRKGEAEHGRDWLNMSEAGLRNEIESEIKDLVIYHAMRLARWQARETAA